MSLKFEGSLTDATIGNWDSETDAGAIGSIVNTTPLKGAEYYYSVADVSGSSTAHFSEDITGQGFESHWGKFRIRFNTDSNFVNSAKSLNIVQGYRSATQDMGIGFATGAGGDVTNLLLRYRTSGGLQSDSSIDFSSSFSFAADKIYEVEYQYKSASPLSDDGLIRVWSTNITDGGSQTLLGQLTDLAIVNANKLTELRFGWLSDQTQTRTIDLGSAQFSTNSNYVDEAETYYIDFSNGAETNTGGSTDPWKYAYQANKSAKAGDSVIPVGTNLVPYRSRLVGTVSPDLSGAVNNNIRIRGNNLADKAVMLGSLSFPPSGWTGPDGNGEYSIDVSGSTTADPTRIYVCTESAWSANGVDAIDPYLQGVSVIRQTAGTAGALAAGEYAYSGGTIYYKPKSGETFADLHIEIPCRTSSDSVCIDMGTNYVTTEWIRALFAVTSCIYASANGTGSQIRYCETSGAGAAGGGIQIGASACEAYANNCSWATDNGASSGDGILCNGAGTGDIIANTCHDNGNDGIAFSSTYTANCEGNVCMNNGYANTGNECGIEVTGAAIITVAHNTCVGNAVHGILNQSTDTSASVIVNNITAYNGTNGIHVTAAQYAADATLLDYNASFGNGNIAFNVVGTGSVSPTGAVTGDPLFTTVQATAGQVTSRNTDNYVLGSGSPCKESTDAASIIENYWGTAARPECKDNAVPDRRASMGAYQG